MRTIQLVSVRAFLTPTHPLATPLPPKRVAGPQPAAHPTYTAAQFFETTNYGIASAAGLAWSRDVQSVLISSDATGVYNVYACRPPAARLSRSGPRPASPPSHRAIPQRRRVPLTSDSGGGGSELTHVYVRELDGTQAARRGGPARHRRRRSVAAGS